MTILYLHGMASSHESFTAACIAKYIPDSKVIVPDLSIDPAIALSQITEILQQQRVDVLVGHSLGGFMAQKFRGYRKVLINPCLGMAIFRGYLGTHPYKHARWDGVQTFHLTHDIYKHYRMLQRTQYDGLDAEEDALTVGVFARYDYYTRLSSVRYLSHYTQRCMIPGAHFPKEDVIRNYIVPVICKLVSGVPS